MDEHLKRGWVSDLAVSGFRCEGKRTGDGKGEGKGEQDKNRQLNSEQSHSVQWIVGVGNKHQRLPRFRVV